MSGRESFTTDEARRYGEGIGIDWLSAASTWSSFERDEYRAGARSGRSPN
jgi:hypothetical protein